MFYDYILKNVFKKYFDIKDLFKVFIPIKLGRKKKLYTWQVSITALLIRVNRAFTLYLKKQLLTVEELVSPDKGTVLLEKSLI